ncbi:MAG: ribosomal protein S18-alanine N-acetyltransferase [Clostridia bacterium]|nr:ribosomal protein S18-alanine N-acetyltransferase [Clostridia bacterium]
MIIDNLKAQYIDGIDSINRLSFSDPWSKNLMEQELDNPNCYYAVGVDDGQVVGYAGMTVIADEANITNVATHPDCRQQGIGKALLGKLIDICIEKNFFLITLEVRKSNIAAISLYESLGFLVEGERKKYYSDNGEDALIMTRRF